MWEVIATSHSLMFISLWIGYQRLMETFTLYSYQQNHKSICICTFSINADMQSRQNNKRFNRTSYLYYIHFLLNIYWYFKQKTDKIPKTYMFWGLRYSICHLLHSFKRPKHGIFKHFVSYLSLTYRTLYCLLIFQNQDFKFYFVDFCLIN